jgi:hypothetical protein
LIHGATHIVKDLVEFIKPHLLKFDTMSCGEGPTSDFPINNRKLVDYILIKFLSPGISNYANNISAMEKPKNQKHQKQSKKENLYYGNLRIFF